MLETESSRGVSGAEPGFVHYIFIELKRFTWCVLLDLDTSLLTGHLRHQADHAIKALCSPALDMIEDIPRIIV